MTPEELCVIKSFLSSSTPQALSEERLIRKRLKELNITLFEATTAFLAAYSSIISYISPEEILEIMEKSNTCEEHKRNCDISLSVAVHLFEELRCAEERS